MVGLIILAVRYATRLQAEKALAAGHGSRLTETVMLGVQRVNEDEVHYSTSVGRTAVLACTIVFTTVCTISTAV